MKPLPQLWLIAARSQNGVIGVDGGLPWHVPADLKLFKERTLGHSLLMGRRTWDSFGGRPLKKRRNIVLSRGPAPKDFPAEWVHSLDEGMELCRGEEGLFIGGGEAIYRMALPRAQRLYLSEIRLEVDGDTRFPDFDPLQWREVERRDFPAEAAAPAFTFRLLHRL